MNTATDGLVKVVVHRFRMADVEDPDLWASESLYKWEHTESGKWVLENAEEVPTWHRIHSADYMSHEYVITALLNPKNYTYWVLKYE